MPMCPHCRSHLGCIHCLPDKSEIVNPKSEIERRDLGVVCGRLYSPAWLIARAKQHERLQFDEIFDYPLQKPAAGFGTSVLPVTFHL